MTEELYSVEQVAERLGLHVRTVRNYVRDGRLNAVRIGKQYRIARSDLEKLTGAAPRTTPRDDARRHRHVEVSTTVQVDAIDRVLAERVSTLVFASLNGRDAGDPPLHVQSFHDEQRASLKVVILGDPLACAELLRLIVAMTDGG